MTDIQYRILIGFGLACLAGLTTVVGSLLGLMYRRPGSRLMSIAIGFSAGVMVVVSFMELLPAAISSLGFLFANIGFFIGIMLAFLADFLIPHIYIGQTEGKNKMPDKLLKTGLFVALGIGIHNFPEGMAVFAGSMKDIQLGIAIAVAIAIHNIAEGLVVSVPILAATNSRRKAFWWSFFSGITEPIGAGIAILFLLPILTPYVLGWMFAIISGIMVYISFDELIPLSCSFGEEHFPILGLIMGMAVMVLSLWLLNVRQFS